MWSRPKIGLQIEVVAHEKFAANLKRTDRLYGKAGNDIFQVGKDGEYDYLNGGSGHDQAWQYYYRHGFLNRKKRYQEALEGIEQQYTEQYRW